MATYATPTQTVSRASPPSRVAYLYLPDNVTM